MDKVKLIACWEAHLGAELLAKDVDATMNTMTARRACRRLSVGLNSLWS